MSKEKEGRADLTHESEPGYKTIFYVVFLIAALYLIVIMAATV